MQNAIQKIWHKEFGSVRVVVLNGTVYFVAIDVARALLYKDTDKAVRERVDAADKIKFDPEKFAKQAEFNSDCGGVKLANGAYLINESGLWALVIHSRLPKAREFQHWLTSEVIPQIVRTGSYIPNDNPAFNPLKEDFTKREKVELLFKLLNLNLPPVLRNKIAAEILALLSCNYEDFFEKLAAEIAE